MTITVKPNGGYEGTLKATDSKGNTVDVKGLGDGKFSFVMPERSAWPSPPTAPAPAFRP